MDEMVIMQIGDIIVHKIIALSDEFICFLGADTIQEYYHVELFLVSKVKFIKFLTWTKEIIQDMDLIKCYALGYKIVNSEGDVIFDPNKRRIITNTSFAKKIGNLEKIFLNKFEHPLILN